MSQSSAQPIRLRWRADLQTEARRQGGCRRWVIRDPVTRRHFQLRDEEYALASLLDGQRDLGAIEQAFRSEFPTLEFSAARFQLFLSRLHRDGLVISEAEGQARVLLERDQQRRRGERRAWWSNLLAIRIPGFDPDRWLTAILPSVRWLFSPVSFAVVATLMLTAILVVVTHAHELPSRLPAWDQFFRPEQIVVVAVLLALTKVLHELGHALTCKYFGGECREMGVLLLFFTPCLYCDVSDSWMIASRWRRAAVAAAGMLVELTLASLATLGWWFSQPGSLHDLCLVIMFVCGVSTLVFNANPLLRYDGYFLLSDWLDIPNLWQRSRAQLWDAVGRLTLGLPRRDPETDDDTAGRWLLGYALLSTAYRGVLLLGCLLFVWRLLGQWDQPVLAGVACGCVVAGGARDGLTRFWQLAKNPSWRRQIRRGRISFNVILGIVAALVVGFLPLPLRVRGPALLQVADATAVYVAVPGILRESHENSDRVNSGDAIAMLDSPALRLELARWTGELAMQRVRVAALESQRGDDAQASARLPSARQSLESLERLVAERQRDLARLTVRASQPGHFFSPPSMPVPVGRAREANGKLPTWTGSPLDRANVGGFLENGTLVGWTGDPSRREAVVYLSQDDLSLVHVRQQVRLQFAPWPGRTFSGSVAEVALDAVKTVPPEIATEGQITGSPDERGAWRPRESTYQIRVSLDSADWSELKRVRGDAKIIVAPQSIGQRVLRAMRRAFAGTP